MSCSLQKSERFRCRFHSDTLLIATYWIRSPTGTMMWELGIWQKTKLWLRVQEEKYLIAQLTDSGMYKRFASLYKRNHRPEVGSQLFNNITTNIRSKMEARTDRTWCCTFLVPYRSSIVSSMSESDFVWVNSRMEFSLPACCFVYFQFNWKFRRGEARVNWKAYTRGSIDLRHVVKTYGSSTVFVRFADLPLGRYTSLLVRE